MTVVISVFYIHFFFFFFSVFLMGNKLVLNFRQVGLIKIHLQMTPYKVLKSTVVTLPPKAEQQYYFSTKKKIEVLYKKLNRYKTMFEKFLPSELYSVMICENTAIVCKCQSISILSVLPKLTRAFNGLIEVSNSLHS